TRTRPSVTTGDDTAEAAVTVRDRHHGAGNHAHGGLVTVGAGEGDRIGGVAAGGRHGRVTVTFLLAPGARVKAAGLIEPTETACCEVVRRLTEPVYHAALPSV